MPVDTPAGMAETDLMARLAVAAKDAIDALRPNEQGVWRCWPVAIAARDAILRTLAAMPELDVMEAALDAGTVAIDAHFLVGDRLSMRDRDTVFLRAAAPLLLARQAGEMERLRKRNEDLEWFVKEGTPFREWAQSYLDGGRWAGHELDDAIKTELLERDAEVATLRAQMREVEEKLAESERQHRAMMLLAAMARPASPVEGVLNAES